MEPIAYATNVHPAEGLEDIAWALASAAGRIRRELDLPRLGLDLRLGSRAVADWRRRPAALDLLRRTMDTHGLVVTSINAFPLGTFQAGRVKDAAYRPDWRDPARLEETLAIAEMAAALVPHGPLILSTVPGSYRPWGDDARIRAEIAVGLGRFCAAAARRERDGGRRTILALEPEPRCTLETAAGTRDFFAGPLAAAGTAAAAAALDGDDEAARAAIDRHLGICFDTCHASVVFDPPDQAVAMLAGCGAGVVKCQVAAAPTVDEPDAHPAGVRALAEMAEPRFLHQVYARRGDDIRCREDLDALPDLLAELPGADAVRCHFHLPLDGDPAADGSPFDTTRDDGLLGLAACRAAGCTVVGVETYTRGILGQAEADIIGGTASELAWLAGQTG